MLRAHIASSVSHFAPGGSKRPTPRGHNPFPISFTGSGLTPARIHVAASSPSCIFRSCVAVGHTAEMGARQSAERKPPVVHLERKAAAPRKPYQHLEIKHRDSYPRLGLVLADFDAEEEGQISCAAGDVLTLLRPNKGVPDGYLLVRIGNPWAFDLEVGTVPAAEGVVPKKIVDVTMTAETPQSLLPHCLGEEADVLLQGCLGRHGTREGAEADWSPYVKATREPGCCRESDMSWGTLIGASFDMWLESCTEWCFVAQHDAKREERQQKRWDQLYDLGKLLHTTIQPDVCNSTSNAPVRPDSCKSNSSGRSSLYQQRLEQALANEALNGTGFRGEQSLPILSPAAKPQNELLPTLLRRIASEPQLADTTPDEAAAVLAEHNGHVGKAFNVIKLRSAKANEALNGRGFPGSIPGNPSPSSDESSTPSEGQGIVAWRSFDL